jgi:hypothetical protein
MVEIPHPVTRMMSLVKVAGVLVDAKLAIVKVGSRGVGPNARNRKVFFTQKAA